MNIQWTEDGEAYDADTGELLSPDDVAASDRAEIAARAYSVDSPNDVTAALDRRQAIESRIFTLGKRRATTNRHFELMIKEEFRRLEWWDHMYRLPVIDFVRRSMTGKKKSIRFPFGVVGFRHSPGTAKIIDMKAAVAFVEGVDPHQVRIEKTVTATIVREVLDRLETDFGQAPIPLDSLPFLETTPPGDKPYIDTRLTDGEPA